MKIFKENKMDYAKDKLYTIPAAFTAMNGAFETYVLTAGVSLEGEEGQADLLRVLEQYKKAGKLSFVYQKRSARRQRKISADAGLFYVFLLPCRPKYHIIKW